MLEENLPLPKWVTDLFLSQTWEVHTDITRAKSGMVEKKLPPWSPKIILSYKKSPAKGENKNKVPCTSYLDEEDQTSDPP